MTTPADLPTQAQVLAWAAVRWPNRVSIDSRALKLGEEAGEVLGAVVRYAEGRGSLDHIAQEAAQTVMCLLGIAEAAGFDLWAEVRAEWASMATRSWPGVAAAPEPPDEPACGWCRTGCSASPCPGCGGPGGDRALAIWTGVTGAAPEPPPEPTPASAPRPVDVRANVAKWNAARGGPPTPGDTQPAERATP